METLLHFLGSPGACVYLPEQTQQMEYDVVASLSRAEYGRRLRAGWRRFGDSLFRPRCPACRACQSLRVVVDSFRPNRSQQRVRKANQAVVQMDTAAPSLTDEKLALYDRYHAFQTELKGWPVHERRDADGYRQSFIHNPASLLVHECNYYLEEKLVGVGYVDTLVEGLSAIYFFYEPSLRHLSLGTWHILSLIEQAARLRLPHVYLGYYVAGCRSMEYKARFTPNEILGPDGRWAPFAV